MAAAPAKSTRRNDQKLNDPQIDSKNTTSVTLDLEEKKVDIHAISSGIYLAPGGILTTPDGRPLDPSVMTDNDLITMMDSTVERLAYVGFKPEDLREDMKNRSNPAEIGLLAAAYVQVGNNSDATTDTRRASAMTSVTPLLRKLKTSLARIAIAYMPLIFLLRRRGVSKGHVKERFSLPRISAEFQDVAFAGWLGETIFDFLLAFDAVVSKTGRPENHGQAAVRRWMEIARNGFISDNKVNQILTQKKPEEISDLEIMEWFKSTFKKTS